MMKQEVKRRVSIQGAAGKKPVQDVLLFGNNAAWHCIVCGEINGDRALDKTTQCRCGKKYEVLPEGKESRDGRAIGVCALPMTEADLAQQLCKMHARAKSGEKTLVIRLFGIQYAVEIKAIRANTRQIAVAAGVSDNYGAEIDKGIALSKYVAVKDTPQVGVILRGQE